jgi:hypothetical protein
MEGAKVAFPLSLWKDVKGHWKGPQKFVLGTTRTREKMPSQVGGCLPHVGCQGMLVVLKGLMFSIMEINLYFL